MLFSLVLLVPFKPLYTECWQHSACNVKFKMQSQLKLSPIICRVTAATLIVLFFRQPQDIQFWHQTVLNTATPAHTAYCTAAGQALPSSAPDQKQSVQTDDTLMCHADKWREYTHFSYNTAVLPTPVNLLTAKPTPPDYFKSSLHMFRKTNLCLMLQKRLTAIYQVFPTQTCP